MKKTTHGMRAAIAAGALGTAIFAGVGNAGAQTQSNCYYNQEEELICITTETRPEETTTTTEATTTTTEAVTTTTMGTTSTTMGTTPTTAAPTTTAPTVGGATGARPVAAQASYTG